VFPQFADRLMQLDPGDEIDLGDTRVVVVEAVFRDYNSTRWAFDTRRGVLFAGDGFSYAHYHAVGQCGHYAEEVPDLDVPETTALFADAAFYWTKFVDIEPHIAALSEMIFNSLKPKLIAPAHGLPITDPLTTFPIVASGLRLGSGR
jgi:flavorubredoxin